MGRLLESAVVAIVALFGAQMMRTYIGKRKIRSDFDYAMQVVAKGAVRRAKTEYRVDLNFAPDSVERLETMLGNIHEAHLKNPLSEKELSLHSIRWGAYIGEVLKRVQPRKWPPRFTKGRSRHHASCLRFRAPRISLFMGIQKDRRWPR